MAERGKNVLLAALLLIMIGLLGLTMLLSMRGSQGGTQLMETFEPDGSGGVRVTSAQAAAFPEKLGLLCPEGGFYALGGDSYRLLWQQVRPLYEEALGSASQPMALSESDYRRLMQPPAVVLQYHTALPFYLLQDWGGTASADESLVRGAALILEEGRVSLLLTDQEGRRVRIETAASAAELEALCAGDWTSNARLAAEDYHSLAWEELLTKGVTALHGLTAQAPDFAQRGELPQRVITLFSMNAFLTKVYPNADGSLVYVESHGTIRLTPQGDLHYSGTGSDLELAETGGAPLRAEICQKVYALLDQLWQVTGASGRLSLEELREENGSYLLRFGLESDGLFLERSQGSWVRAQVKNGVLCELFASPRSLTEAKEDLLLPMTQAAAALPEGKARLCVRLMEQEKDTFAPVICRVTEE